MDKVIQDCFYRRNKRFDVVAFPDDNSLVRSGLPIYWMFFYAGNSKCGVKKAAVIGIASGNYNEYLEFMPHAKGIDFLAEPLFITAVT